MAESETCLPKKGIDRISSLPKPLISRILSFLPTTCAVSTSVLSTKWRFFWTSITNLNLVNMNFSERFPNMSHEMKSKIFTQFVNRVLFLLDSHCIQNFNLMLHKDLCDTFYLHSWICAAFWRTTQTLDLGLKLAKPMELPFSHICRSTLTILKMVGSIHFNIATSSSICFPNLKFLNLNRLTFTIANNCSVSFPSLKNLFLESVQFSNDEPVNKLLASCPVLDVLTILRVGYDIVRCLVISIPSLKRLRINLYNIFNLDGSAYKIRIDTPALEVLYLGGDSSNVCFSAESLSSLLKARLSYSFGSYVRTDHNNFLKFMGALVNVKFLSISGDILKAFASKSEIISPGFCNLTYLDLDVYNCHEWSFVVKNVLESMVNLRHLVMKACCFEYHEPWWTEPLHVPMCLVQRLASISFKNMVGDCSDELELVRFFLKNAKVLQMFLGGLAAKTKLMRKISMMPRGSPGYPVVFEDE